MRPLYSREAIDTTPTGPRLDRRGLGLVKRSRRFWWHLTDALGFAAYILLYGMAIILGASAVLWLWSDIIRMVR